MNKERLQEIKDSVEFQKEILEAHNMNTLCVDEEQELVEEVERLRFIIKEVRELRKQLAFEYYENGLEVGVNVVIEDLDKILDKESK